MNLELIILTCCVLAQFAAFVQLWGSEVAGSIKLLFLLNFLTLAILFLFLWKKIERTESLFEIKLHNLEKLEQIRN